MARYTSPSSSPENTNIGHAPNMAKPSAITIMMTARGPNTARLALMGNELLRRATNWNDADSSCGSAAESCFDIACSQRGGLINSMMDRSASSSCAMQYRQWLRQLTEVRSDHGAGGHRPYARWRRTRQLAPADSLSV